MSDELAQRGPWDMDDLIAFLNAREDEREADANERHTVYCAALDPCYEPPEFDNPDFSRCDCKQRWTLADIAAKRQIIKLHAPAGDLCQTCKWEYSWIDSDGEWETNVEHEEWPCRTLRLLALPFASHPDYREEYRP